MKRLSERVRGWLAVALMVGGTLIILAGCDVHGTCGADNRDPLCHQSW